MSNPTWTRERPIVAGWYWYKEGKEIAVLTFVSRGLEMAFSMPLTINARHSYPNWSVRTLAYMVGEWLGPITPDSYQQGRVAGIKQGIEKLREREKFYTEQEAISEGQMRLTRGLQRNESSCCIHELEKLAQAAQDEKEVGDANTKG